MVEKTQEEIRWIELCRSISKSMFLEMSKYKLCKNCNKILGIDISDMIGELSFIRCPHCNADLSGKVYPKKRELPREIKDVEITENPELDQIVIMTIRDNPKVVSEFREKPKSVGFLVGQVLKKIKVNPAEVKLRLERELEKL